MFINNRIELQIQLSSLHFGNLFHRENWESYTVETADGGFLIEEIYSSPGSTGTPMRATLYFDRLGTTDDFSFVKFRCTLTDDVNNKTRMQTFIVGRHNFGLREAYNLLCGRAVYLQLSTYSEIESAWIKLDFSQTDPYGNYPYLHFHGFDVEKAIALYPILEINDPEYFEKVLESLKRGNQVPVTFPGKVSLVRLMEANPVARILCIRIPGRKITPPKDQ